MKKLITGSAMLVAVLILANCSSTKKIAAVPKLTYETNVKTVVVGNCSPCHIPASGGNKRPYDNYANLKADIDEIIRRVSLQTTERGYMPFKRPHLADSTIMVFKQWKADGLLET